MNYRCTKRNTSPMDFKVTPSGEIRWATWPGSVVGNCPYTAEEINRVRRIEAMIRHLYELSAVASLKGDPFYLDNPPDLSGETPEEFCGRQPDHILHKIIGRAYTPSADAEALRNYMES